MPSIARTMRITAIVFVRLVTVIPSAKKTRPSRSGVVPPRTLPPGPGVGHQADLGKCDPEAGHRDYHCGGRDPGENSRLQVLRPLTDLREPGFEASNRRLHRLQAPLNSRKLSSGGLRI